MTGWTITDLVALYGAALSTVIAGASLIYWYLDGPKLSVFVFHPSEWWEGSGNFGFVISNAGKFPIVVSAVIVDFLNGSERSSLLVESVEFNQSTFWNPATKDVRDPHKPNTFTREVQVLAPGEELKGVGKPVNDYDPKRHWIKVTAFPRGSKKGFVGMVGPKTPDGGKIG